MKTSQRILVALFLMIVQSLSASFQQVGQSNVIRPAAHSVSFEESVNRALVKNPARELDMQKLVQVRREMSNLTLPVSLNRSRVNVFRRNLRDLVTPTSTPTRTPEPAEQE